MLAGDPVFWGIAAATVELGHWLHLPVRAGAASTDADHADLQAGMESALGLAFAFERGVDFILQGMGALSSLNALSFDKLVVDDDLVGALKTRPWQLDLGPESLACDVIAEVGPGGIYLGHRHTRKYGRGRASLFSRDVPESGRTSRAALRRWRPRGSPPCWTAIGRRSSMPCAGGSSLCTARSEGLPSRGRPSPPRSVHSVERLRSARRRELGTFAGAAFQVSSEAEQNRSTM